MSRYGPVGDHRGVPRREPKPTRAGAAECRQPGLCRDRDRGLRDGSRSPETRGEEGEKAAGETRPRCRDGGDRPGVGNGGSVTGDGERPRSPERAAKSRPAADSGPRTPPGRSGSNNRSAAARTGPGLRDEGEAGLRGWQRCRCPGAPRCPLRGNYALVPRYRLRGNNALVPRYNNAPVPRYRLQAPALPGLPGTHVRSSRAPGFPWSGCPGAPHPSPGSDRTGLVPGALPPFLCAFPAGPVGGSHYRFYIIPHFRFSIIPPVLL